MLKRRLIRAVVFACAAILAAGAAGAAGAGNTAFGAPSYRASSNKEEVKGRILVSGGPDISISYDKDGTVLEIKGIDRDGKNFLEGQEGYVGKSCKTAVGRLVRRLDEKGWFGEHADGSRKSLVVKAEKGSEYPERTGRSMCISRLWEPIHWMERGILTGKLLRRLYWNSLD